MPKKRRNPEETTVRLVAWVSPRTARAISRRAETARKSVGAYLDETFAKAVAADTKTDGEGS
jgi:hypothetical protein